MQKRADKNWKTKDREEITDTQVTTYDTSRVPPRFSFVHPTSPILNKNSQDRIIRLKRVFIFNLALSRLARLLDGQAVVVADGAGSGAGSVGIGEVAVTDGAGFGRDRDVGHLLDDVGQEVELVFMDNGLLQVAGRDAFAVALAGLFGGLVAKRNHKQLKRFGNDDGCNLDGEWLVLSTQLEGNVEKMERKKEKRKE